MRRLPVYLLLDVSGSMSGEPIEAVKNGVQTMHSALRKDPYALESAFLSVITFSNDARQIMPLTEVSQFQPPSFTAGGGTAMDGALRYVAECVNRDIVKSTAEQKGDWKPLIFIMTDGAPTDTIGSGLAEFQKIKWGMVVACAAGHGADTKVLERIAGENVVSLDTADSTTIAAFFKWVSSSISASSKRVDIDGSEAGSLSELPPPPPEITLAKP